MARLGTLRMAKTSGLGPPSASAVPLVRRTFNLASEPIQRLATTLLRPGPWDVGEAGAGVGGAGQNEQDVGQTVEVLEHFGVGVVGVLV